MMKPTTLKSTVLTVALLSSAAVSHGQTINNPWSGVAGDRANLSSFAFQADAGLYPDSVTPAGGFSALDFSLNQVTLTRPGDATTPNFGEGAFQITSSLTPIYLDVYTGFDGSDYSGYLGSSSTGVAWDSTAPGADYSFDFISMALSTDQKYWLVFSEDAIDGEISQFRAQVNTSGNDATPGAGRGYLVGDTMQVVTSSGAPQDWGIAYSFDVTPVPEPSSVALLGLGGAALGLIALRRGRR